MTKTDYIGVILAAGKGSRLGPFGERFPKPLLPVCNKPLIQHQLEIVKGLGIRDIIVLIGHRGFEISKQLSDGSSLDMNMRYVEQTSFLGIAHAVGCLERYISRPFLLLLGDIFFRQARLEKLFETFESQSGGAVLAVKEESDPEAIKRNFSVHLSSDGLVTRVIEKPRHATNRLKGVGIYLFDLTIFDAIRRTPRTAMRDEYELTHAIQVLIEDGFPVRPCSCVELDINVTYPADLLHCNLEQARFVGAETVVGDNVSIHPAAQISDSVIGANVRVKNPIRISRSLIFADTVVGATTDLDTYIVTPDGMMDCKVDLRPGETIRSRG